MKVCLHCKEPLVFTRDKGWVHQDGSIYKRRRVTGHERVRLEMRLEAQGRELRPQDEWVDDHCVFPVDDLVASCDG